MGRRKIDVRVRLEQHLVRRPNNCLEWTGLRDKDGYGIITEDGVQKRAHRVAWALVYGPIPKGEVIRHYVCDNPPCCEPTHLRSGTQAQNIADRDAQGNNWQLKKKHCPQGHEYNGKNLYVNPTTGYRHCRTCMAIRGRANHLARYVPHPKVKNPYKNWSPSGWSTE